MWKLYVSWQNMDYVNIRVINASFTCFTVRLFFPSKCIISVACFINTLFFLVVKLFNGEDLHVFLQVFVICEVLISHLLWSRTLVWRRSPCWIRWSQLTLTIAKLLMLAWQHLQVCIMHGLFVHGPYCSIYGILLVFGSSH